MKYLIAAAALLAAGTASAYDLRAEGNYNSCMDRFAPWTTAGSDSNFAGSDYCDDRRRQDLDVDRRLKALEDDQ